MVGIRLAQEVLPRSREERCVWSSSGYRVGAVYDLFDLQNVFPGLAL